MFGFLFACESFEEESGSIEYCETNKECKEGFFCKKEIGDCEGIGTCEKMPMYCLDYYKPVCGCDGGIYSNECYAYRVGVNVKDTNCE
ncbi:MAG: hypothetical protein GXO22_07940 [Aquificae bacterium]|nr:hypothetical protein [Aquificota bacterium]